MESYQGGVAYEAPVDAQRLQQTIATNIQKISQNVSSITKMVNQLQTPQDSQELRNQLRQLQNYTQKLAKDTSSQIMQLMKAPGADASTRVARDRLSDEYMATLNAFQVTQRTAAQKTKEDVRKVKAQNVKISDPFAIGDGPEEGDSRRQQQLTAEAERDLRQLEERERDVRQLESDIMDVNHIFTELGQMIHEQGAAVDSIESSVEGAARGVESGVRELHQAAGYKNSMRKKKVYIAIILIIVVSIILIVALHH